MAEKEYIERNGLLKWAREFYPDQKVFASAVINAPTADVQEVRHGEWIISSDGYYPYCSECWKEPKEISEFCPHCGAKMDKE